MDTVKIILAIVAGFIAGSLVNMGVISLSPHVIAPPPGVDLADMESIKAAMPFMGPQYFLFPFLAHALGTLVGAFIAVLIAPKGKEWTAWVIAFMFLTGGIAASFMIPAPKWFVVVDLVLAYLPMAWLAIQAERKIKTNG